MQTSGPVDSDVAFLPVQPGSALHTSTGTDAAEFEETVKYRTIVTDVELGLFALEVVHVLGADLLQKINVLVGVELGHLQSRGGLCAVDLHLLVDAIVHDETVGQSYAMRLHGMASDVGEVANVRVVEVGNLFRRWSAERDAIAIGINWRCVRHVEGCS